MPSNTWLAWALTLVICIERSPSKPWRHHHFLPPWSHHVPPGLPQHGMCERIACHFERRARNQQMECGHTNHVKYAGIYVFEWFLHFQKIWVLSKNGGVGSYTCDGAMLHHALQNLRRQRLFPRVADPGLSTIRLWVKIGYPIRWLIPNMYPLVNIQIAIENGPVEIVDLPIKHGDFPYVKLPGTFQSVVIYPLVN